MLLWVIILNDLLLLLNNLLIVVPHIKHFINQTINSTQKPFEGNY